MHQNLLCSSLLLSLEAGMALLIFFFVILFDSSTPLLNPSSKDFFKVKDPFADPTVLSFWRAWLGTNAFIFSLNFNLFPDCEERWTVGVQFPETHIQSQEISYNFS